MQARDLQQWEDCPESFHHEADVGSWEDHLRSFAETLLATLLEVAHTWTHQQAKKPSVATLGLKNDRLPCIWPWCQSEGAAPLAQDDREGVAPVMVDLLKARSEACPPGSAASQQGQRIGHIPAAVLAKEAVYNALGVGAYDLHDYIDFKQWLQTALLQVCCTAASLTNSTRSARTAYRSADRAAGSLISQAIDALHQ